uniref:Uncharacterized protein n=1 Tax=Arundo donax TaxID=35708 RepID=A0A0A9F899_ARUDO
MRGWRRRSSRRSVRMDFKFPGKSPLMSRQ